VSLNLLQASDSPKGWLAFANKYGAIGHSPILDHWHMGEKRKEGGHRIYEVEHEGEWHHLVGVLSRIYRDYQAIKEKDSRYLKKIIKWESGDVVREDRGLEMAGTRICPAIAMRGRYRHNSDYFNHMKRPDVFTPAAFSIRDYVNRYLEKSVSLQVSFEPKTLEFRSSLRYGSLGAALVAEAVEFMAGHFEARQCIVCGSWFRVGAGQTRVDRRFCSAACKMRAYRARKLPDTKDVEQGSRTTQRRKPNFFRGSFHVKKKQLRRLPLNPSTPPA
jgi:hypothetical protein